MNSPSAGRTHPRRALFSRVALVALAAFAGACDTPPDATDDIAPPSELETIHQAIGNAYPAPHALQLSKRQYTWTIKTLPDGFFAPKVSWTINRSKAELEEANRTMGAFPAGVTITAISSTQTLVDYQRMSNSYVDNIMTTVVRTWVSRFKASRRYCEPADGAASS